MTRTSRRLDGDFRFTVHALPSWAGAVPVHNASHTLGERSRTAVEGNAHHDSVERIAHHLHQVLARTPA